MIKTDILIIGAGPTGLFAVFEAGFILTYQQDVLIGVREEKLDPR